MTAKRIELDDHGAQVGDVVFVPGRVFEAREGSNVRLIEMTRRAFIRTKDGYDFVDPIPMLVAFYVEEVWQQRPPLPVQALSVADVEVLIEALEHFCIGPSPNAELEAIWQPYIDKLKALIPKETA
jgi:hypothetical protein